MNNAINRLTFDRDGWPDVLPVLGLADFETRTVSEWIGRCFSEGSEAIDTVYMMNAIFFAHWINDHHRWSELVAACGYTEDCETEDLWE